MVETKKKLCVLYIQSNTTIFHLVVQWVYDYIGCNYMFRSYMLAIFRLSFKLQRSYSRCVGCFLGYWGGGTKVLGVRERDVIPLPPQ